MIPVGVNNIQYDGLLSYTTQAQHEPIMKPFPRGTVPGSAKTWNHLSWRGLDSEALAASGTEARFMIPRCRRSVCSVGGLTATETGSTTDLSFWVAIFGICCGFIYHLWAVWATALSRTDADSRLLCAGATGSLESSGI